MANGLLITGTDTGVGKTVLTAAVVSKLRAEGVAAVPFKPAISGTDEPVDVWPHDHVLLGQCAGLPSEQVAPLSFGPAVSPHLAAAMAGVKLDPQRFIEDFSRVSATADPIIVEGIGGWMVPMTDNYLVADFAQEIKLPVVLVARTGLGTINHTLLTLEAIRSRGLTVKAVVLNQWPDRPSELELSNRETIQRLGQVDVHTLGVIQRPSNQELTQAAATLPVSFWLNS